MDVPGAHVLGEKGNAPAAEPHRDGDVGSAAIGGSLVAQGGTGWQGPAAAGAVVAPGAAQVARLKHSRRVVAVFCVLILSCPHVPPCYPLLPL